MAGIHSTGRKATPVLTIVNADGSRPNGSQIVREGASSSSACLSPSTVTRLTVLWRASHRIFMDRDLSSTDYVYLRADGFHPRIRFDEAKAVVLVLMGVRADGTAHHQGP